MTPIEQVEQLLTEACDQAIKNGYQIVPLEFVKTEYVERCCCPFGAFSTSAKYPTPGNVLNGAMVDACILTVSYENVADFMSGFDNKDDGSEWNKLGIKFREKYYGQDVSA